MEKSEKINNFSVELDYIKNERIKLACMRLLSELPDYFFEVPASSTGKYHPEFAAGPKGLVRHSKAAVKVAHDILNNDKTLFSTLQESDYQVLNTMYEQAGISYDEIASKINNLNGDDYSDDEKDLLIMGTMIHDGLKHGVVESKYTKHGHPEMMANYVINEGEKAGLTAEETNYVASVIKTHMGPFINNKYDHLVLQPARTKEQLLVFMSDYISSRKLVPIFFDENNNVINKEKVL